MTGWIRPHENADQVGNDVASHWEFNQSFLLLTRIYRYYVENDKS